MAKGAAASPLSTFTSDGFGMFSRTGGERNKPRCRLFPLTLTLSPGERELIERAGGGFSPSALRGEGIE
ncbi:hypothetical protein AB182_28930 [Phytobacter ursingii]|uniref:Uncharacterized protein n=1 Tax=Phytobacter ursingii TaxID=1972431 RepID=A0AAC8QU50_9ENTR|nr:hypothetical protein AB182_28930 [Phytobacter ursingii]